MGMLVVAPAGSFHPHSHHHHHDSLFPSAGGDHHHSIIPLLSVVDDSAKGVPPAGIPLWQPQPQNPNLNLTSAAAPYLKKPVPALDVASGGGSATCQDCGNQAKKDCPHRRCRTCCKSRGFECNTHVKSTWVPAARRRERQLSGPGGGPGPGSSTSTSAPKKPRLSSQTTSHTSTSNTTRSFDTGSSRRQDASFRESLPGQVQAPAVFKCVRVTSVDDGKDEYAYHAMVRIGGHLFKGFLYDHGAEDRGDESHHHAIAAGETGANTTNNASNAIPNISELHLGGGGGGGGGRNGASSSSPMLPSDMFGGGGGGLLGGTAYGNPIN